MLAIDDFGSPSRRASSLGPTGSPLLSASTSRIARRARNGRSERVGLGSRRRVASVDVVAAVTLDRPPSHLAIPIPDLPARPVSAPDSRMDRVQHIDFACPAVPILFNLPPVVQYAGRPRRVKRRTPVSRFRSIAPVIGLILVIAGCNAATPSASDQRGPAGRLGAGGHHRAAPRRSAAATPAPLAGDNSRASTSTC